MRVSGLPAVTQRGAFMCLAICIGMIPITAYPNEVLEVRCADGRNFDLQIEERRATAYFEGHRLILPQRPFELGAYYRSEEGALVIDGAYAAFVPRGDTNWRDCEIQNRGVTDKPS